MGPKNTENILTIKVKLEKNSKRKKAKKQPVEHSHH